MTSYIYQVYPECSAFLQISNGCIDRRRRRSTSDTVTITIGEEECSEQKEDIFCNGPLEADSIYYLVLRAYSNGYFKNTEISNAIQTGI